MIKIYHNNKTYNISKSKLIFTLSKLEDRKIGELEIDKILKKFNLLDDEFLESILKL